MGGEGLLIKGGDKGISEPQSISAKYGAGCMPSLHNWQGADEHHRPGVRSVKYHWSQTCVHPMLQTYARIAHTGRK